MKPSQKWTPGGPPGHHATIVELRELADLVIREFAKVHERIDGLAREIAKASDKLEASVDEEPGEPMSGIVTEFVKSRDPGGAPRREIIAHCCEAGYRYADADATIRNLVEGRWLKIAESDPDDYRRDLIASGKGPGDPGFDCRKPTVGSIRCTGLTETGERYTAYAKSDRPGEDA